MLRRLSLRLPLRLPAPCGLAELSVRRKLSHAGKRAIAVALFFTPFAKRELSSINLVFSSVDSISGGNAQLRLSQLLKSTPVSKISTMLKYLSIRPVFAAMCSGLSGSNSTSDDFNRNILEAKERPLVF